MGKSKAKPRDTLRFEAANFDSIFPVLDAICWLEMPDVRQVAQFAGIDPRTAGKLLKNCTAIGIVEVVDNKYSLALPYPYKASGEQKKAVIREALVRLPLMTYMRQFLSLGDPLGAAVRKSATVVGEEQFDARAFTPLLKWAKQLDVLKPELVVEDLVDEGSATKEIRHKQDSSKVVAFLSHSSQDKPIIRQIAADLTKAGIGVWLDEQRILVGESITDRISQGLAQSDFFLIALTEASVKSEWVRKELNSALLTEVEQRKVVVLPLKISECEIPPIIKDKKYADFSKSYKQGLSELLQAMKRE